jgi:hypothetical protein
LQEPGGMDFFINLIAISFTPDAWQYDLIKLIDQDQTVLVVVPTSAGKTFSSFYVISRMLEKMKKEKSNLGTSSARIGELPRPSRLLLLLVNTSSRFSPPLLLLARSGTWYRSSSNSSFGPHPHRSTRFK